MNVEIRKNMRGGEGEVTITNIVNKEELKNARLLAYISIPVGASIGEHEHKDETEYYIILIGRGEVEDNGSLEEVQEGDVVITGGGASHSIKNIGSTELNMLAVIITY
jgi:mannose-6-phosphate isomerase-like protein (cupin superfamily)